MHMVKSPARWTLVLAVVLILGLLMSLLLPALAAPQMIPLDVFEASGAAPIDDFEIPWEPDFKYDGYPDVRINVDTVRKFLGKREGEFSMFLPSYGPDIDPGGIGIGYAGKEWVDKPYRFVWNQKREDE